MHACLQFLPETMEKAEKGLNLYGDQMKHSTAKCAERKRDFAFRKAS